MALRSWKKLDGRDVLRNPWWTYRLDTYELPSGRTGEYHHVHTNGSSMVLPVMDDGRVVMVNQYRYLADRESVEFPCGSIKDGSGYEETARQELAEEAGCSARSLTLAGAFNPYNGVTDEICRVYVARGLSPVPGTPDDTEEFEILRLTPAEIDDRIRRGEIWDGMSIAAWAVARETLGTSGEQRP